jgi:DNA-binding PadR family transcriptional regulator
MQPRITPLALAVLRMLHAEPMHPYEMQQRIRDWGINEVIKVTHGALYHTVDRLTECELIEPVETLRAGRRPERTVYAITDAGREMGRGKLIDMLSSVDREYPVFRAALAFLSLLSPEEAAIRLGMRAVHLQALLAGADTAYDALIKKGISRIQLIEFDHARAQTRAELDVVQSIIDDIESGRLTWTPASHAPADRKADHE